MKLEVKNLCFSYQDGEHKKVILDHANAEFESGKIYAVLGVSGSGKSTLLSLLGTIDEPDSGEILLDDESIFKNDTDYRKYHLGFVFQNFNLIEDMTSIENIELARVIAGKPRDKQFILDALELVGIDYESAKKRVSKLSGGEHQRVAIARAIINNPQIILADEPTGNLDQETSLKVMQIFLRLAHEFNKCVIFVTHNQDLAKMCDLTYTVANKQIG